MRYPDKKELIEFIEDLNNLEYFMFLTAISDSYYKIKRWDKID